MQSTVGINGSWSPKVTSSESTHAELARVGVRRRTFVAVSAMPEVSALTLDPELTGGVRHGSAAADDRLGEQGPPVVNSTCYQRHG
ncbi:hypothetical protein [Frigoribacterium faeni]|uniref:Uncharacterized protein n=1 Tax=Frigoribacterium faeni TaxID=145483 RepID=A0A7W3JJV2_9MICO|nr:hypothetical protein [Frigoribacterium faeni]MBA8814177.1 hypothetical protein [Frigoribacterium faeni]BFF16231.1 hypothetical protein GCM10025699_75340 [Microbacterium flavescens]GEK84136.1 hypothetical protein FFA01_24450 [Frigoribacterium faeni]